VEIDLAYRTAWDKMLHHVIIFDYICKNLKTQPELMQTLPTKFKYTLDVIIQVIYHKPYPLCALLV
jgi:hypothetical protein